MQRLVALVCGIALALVSTVACAEPELTPVSATNPEDDVQLYRCKEKTSAVSVTFKPETELKDLVTWAMGFTCRNFMFDQSYVQRSKKLTIIAPNTMTPQEAYRVFLVALSTIGLTVVPKGNVLRIVESATARAESVPLVHGTPDNSEQIVRFVLRPTYAQVATVQAALNAMKSAAGDIQVVGTVLLVTDYATHVRDMLEVVKQIDVPGGTDGVYTYQVKYADADKVAKELEGYLAMTVPAADKNAPAALPPKMMVDARTNTLIIAANDATWHKLRAIVETIDVPVETESGSSMHVYPLKAAIAEEVAKVMNEAISGQAKSTTATQGKNAAALDQLQLEGEAHVIADKGTNKLIVMSSGRDFLALKSIIQELDEPRRQVYIEATILEVELENDYDFGFAEHGTVETKHGAVVIGGVESASSSGGAGLSSTSPASLAGLTGLLGGVLGPALKSSSLLGSSFPSYGLVFQALGTNAHTRVLSAPSVIVLDNEETKYQVGTNIPYSKGVIPISAVTPTAGTQTNIDRKDLLLELDIKPHISSGDEVLLEFKHVNNELLGTDTLGPTWSTRTMETRVVVRDQQTVVIGGLMQQKDHTNVTSVPILGDIPVLGNLFRYTTKQKVKTNLLVMLTPFIIKDQLDLEQIRERRQREADEFMNSQRALDGMKLDRSVDYARKRGVVEEINRAVESVEQEAAQRAQVVHPPAVPTGPITPSRD